MASGIFAILDDIAALMDDVAVMSKVAAKKTAGILGDDLAVNAEKASGFVSSREIPVLWKITKGSFINKLIILPLAFLLSAFVPVVIGIILLIGGFYLAYEGAEKIMHFLKPNKQTKKENLKQAQSEAEVLSIEKERIKSAIITDFILSVEIIIIALGTVENESISIQILVVSIIALLATVGVYGIVALIVRMDDAGFALMQNQDEESGFRYKLGELLVKSLPKVVKSLSVIGTIALLMVSGGIFTHEFHALNDFLPSIPSILKEMMYGLIAGITVFLIVQGIKTLIKKK